MMTFDFNSYLLFLFISFRIAGVIFFNPIFGRRIMPNIVKIGLSLGIAFNAFHELTGISFADYGAFDLMLTVIKEFAVGFSMGFVMQIFLAVFHMGGELMDLQMGISMASMYDPSSNSQISITGNILTAMYTLLFFITNSHINLLAIAVKSFNVIPVGLSRLNPGIAIYAIELFGYMLVYAVQLALPLIIVEVLVEAAVGMLMRVVPNINVFVVNLQLKLGIGLIVMITILPVLVNYLEKLNGSMLQRLQQVLMYLQ